MGTIRFIRWLTLLLTVGCVARCHALVAAPSAEEAERRVDNAIAQRPFQEAGARAIKTAHDHALAAQKAELESIRGKNAPLKPPAVSAALPPSSHETSTWIFLGALAGTPAIVTLFALWLTRRAMRIREQEANNLPWYIRPSSVGGALPESSAKSTKRHAQAKELADLWAQRQRENGAAVPSATDAPGDGALPELDESQRELARLFVERQRELAAHIPSPPSIFGPTGDAASADSGTLPQSITRSFPSGQSGKELAAVLAARQEELSVEPPRIPKESEDAIAADDSALPKRKTKNFQRGQPGKDLAALLVAQQEELSRKASD